MPLIVFMVWTDVLNFDIIQFINNFDIIQFINLFFCGYYLRNLNHNKIILYELCYCFASHNFCGLLGICLWCELQVSVLFLYGYPICPPQVIENNIIFPLLCRVSHDKSSIHFFVFFCFCALSSFIDVFFFLVLILHCINCYVFIMTPKFWVVCLSHCFFLECFGYS